MAAALAWGALSASSLIIGALLGLARDWPDKIVGAVLAFGAGALISAISFDLAEEGSRLGGGELGCERSGSFHRVPAGIDGADARWRSSAAG